MTITAPITSPTSRSANTDQRADGENSQRHALRNAPGGFAVATGLLGRENDGGDRLQVSVARGDLLVVLPAAGLQEVDDLALGGCVALVLLRNRSPGRSLLGRRRRVAATALFLGDD